MQRLNLPAMGDIKPSAPVGQGKSSTSYGKKIGFQDDDDDDWDDSPKQVSRQPAPPRKQSPQQKKQQ